MTPPVRLVCGECLRSVELVPDEVGRIPTICPSCGATIEDQLDSSITPRSQATFPVADPEDSTQSQSVRWSEVLSRGTLGTIGRFQLRDLLGDGGFGQVYKAYDPRLDRDLALKVLRELEPGDRVMQRFFREARAAGRLSHPCIVGVYDAGYDDGRCWIAFEFVTGCTLARRLDQQDLDAVTAVRIARDLGDALHHAHDEGVYHRDIKPANVIIDHKNVPHLIDFGLARRADVDSGLTREGSVLGTPRYMPPEQADGRSHMADARSDVYSLGVLLFEMLGGRRSDPTPSRAAPWFFKPATRPPPLGTINPSAPAALEAICSKALASEPLERFADAGAFARALDHWLERRWTSALIEHPAVGIGSVLVGSVVLAFAIVSSMSGGAGLPTVRSQKSLIADTQRDLARSEGAPPLLVDDKPSINAPPEPAGQFDDFSPVCVILNSKDKVFHTMDCSHFELPDEKNRRRYSKARDAKADGYSPCDRFIKYARKSIEHPETSR